mmetsp:Transcript_12443/g.31573  ORF Transcript_12443/g.31573 Transcript_12443/m.31573 type:complete len:228 (+) Transcript_12443:320-1003(+)
MKSSPKSFISHVVLSMPTLELPLACCARRDAMVSVVFMPAFSARVVGTTSSASANFWMAYCSRPVCFLPNSRSFSERASSDAPPAAKTLASLPKALKVFTPSSIARSMSSMRWSVAPRRMMVATRPTLSSWRSTVTRLPPISTVSTRLARPSWSLVGTANLGRATAPVDRQILRSSNLLVILMAIMPYLSMKCIAISPMADPLTTTLVPRSAIPLTSAWSSSSSLLW